ncbi:MAG: SprT-like family protein [Frankiales bacterium]|nr:SprT-like family protein [Frankiales bacterium]
MSATGGTVRRMPARPASDDPQPLVEVVRSARRRRTVSAYRDGERTVVLIPARMSKAEENRWVAEMVARLAKQETRQRRSDSDLDARAADLSRKFLGARAKPASVRWVDNQRSRWGSCTPSDRSIRLSSRLRGMPSYVVDYVLLHELAHLLVPGHGPAFWAELAQYPQLERARGYLEGVAATAGLAISDEGPDDGLDARAGAEGSGAGPDGS